MKRSSESGMSVIVRTVTCVAAIPVIIFGLYVIMHGHLTPGGGFAGGAIIATMTALFIVAEGGDAADRLGRGMLLTAESAGLVLFALLGFLGLRTTFFYNFLANTGSIFGTQVPFGPNPGYLNTAGVIPLMNLVVGLEVFAALSLVVIFMFSYRKEEQ